jgi:hypothetical protein
MTVGEEVKRHLYLPSHPQNGLVQQTLEPPRWGMEVPRWLGQKRIQLSWLFVAGII